VIHSGTLVTNFGKKRTNKSSVGETLSLIDARSYRRQRLTGIALMCGAVACFACLDTSAKFLGREMSVIQVVWARYAGAFALAFALSNPLTRPGLMRTSRPAVQIGRALALVLSSFLNFLALRYLQLDQALAITFSTPFLVAVLAGPILGEWVGARRWAAIGVGFIGVLVVARPGIGNIHPAALFSLAAAFTLAFYNVSTRLLARTDSSETTLFYSNLVGLLVTTPMLPSVWTPPHGGREIILMAAIGALGTIGHYLLILAHRLAPASVLSPFMYTQLVWVLALGYGVFGDLPNNWTLLGAGIVVASGLYLLHRERIRSGG
jgi:drug/metabolite transporter (DMT)-like permease